MQRLFACLAIASLILLQGYTSLRFINEVTEKTEVETGTLLNNEVKEKAEIGTGTLLATIGSTVEEKQVATYLVEEGPRARLLFNNRLPA
jgi:hypothetical protein